MVEQTVEDDGDGSGVSADQMIQIGTRLSRVFAQRGHDTQEEVARALGVSQRTINGVVNGRLLPNIKTILRMKEMGIDYSYVLFGENSGNNAVRIIELERENATFQHALTTVLNVAASVTGRGIPEFALRAGDKDGKQLTEKEWQIAQDYRNSNGKIKDMIEQLISFNAPASTGKDTPE
jgi:transcriptional regulator with XRE-family HTH domain